MSWLSDTFFFFKKIAQNLQKIAQNCFDDFVQILEYFEEIWERFEHILEQFENIGNAHVEHAGIKASRYLLNPGGAVLNKSVFF